MMVTEFVECMKFAETMSDLSFIVKTVEELNLFSTNIPLMEKPGRRFLPAKCLKNNVFTSKMFATT